jgi:hypothetical protein
MVLLFRYKRAGEVSWVACYSESLNLFHVLFLKSTFISVSSEPRELFLFPFSRERRQPAGPDNVVSDRRSEASLLPSVLPATFPSLRSRLGYRS